MYLGEIIKKYRKENNLSQRDFEKKSGISRSYISVLERNSHPDSKEPVFPSLRYVIMAAAGMDMDFDELFHMIDDEIPLTSFYNETINSETDKNIYKKHSPIRIPILGKVAAGQPIDALEDILGYEEIPSELAKRGDCFGLRIKGNSMEPRIYDGDTVIVLKQDTADSGDIVIATVNDDDAVCKKLIKRGKKTVLRSLNPSYDDIDVTKDSGFHIIGLVVELRAKL